MNTNKSSVGERGCLSIFATSMLYVIFGILIFYAMTGFTKWFNGNNNIQREAEIHMNALIESGDELPIGEYADLEVNLVFGPYATYTQSREMSRYEITAVVKETEYYFIILEDMTVMSIATANDNEKAVLSRLSNQLENAIMTNSTPSKETYLVRGELTEMENGELRDIFEENADYLFGLTPDSPALRTVVLDTDAGREGGYNIATAVIVFIVFIIVLLLSKIRKNKSEEQYDHHGETKPPRDLSALYQESGSITQDHHEDIYYHERAAEAGDAEAMHILSEMYASGTGVAQDAEKAKYWAKKAKRTDLLDKIKSHKLLIFLIILFLLPSLCTGLLPLLH